MVLPENFRAALRAAMVATFLEKVGKNGAVLRD